MVVHVPFRRRIRAARQFLLTLSLLGLCWSVALPTQAAARDAFPDPRPATRAAAVALVAGETPTPLGCLTPQVQGLTLSGGRPVRGLPPPVAPHFSGSSKSGALQTSRRFKQ